jgi:PAS domain-containing protein
MRDPPWRSRVCRRIALVVFCTVLMMELMLAAWNYQTGRALMFEGLHDTARTYLTSAVDRRRFPDSEALAGVGENLLFATNIRGGVFVDAIGEDVVAFGERPDLTWQMATLRGQTWRYSMSSRLYEVYLPPETLGIPFGVLLQLDAKDVHAAHRAGIKQRLVQGLAVASLIAIVVALLVGWFALAPTQRIRRAIHQANETPSKAADHLVRLKTDTEMDIIGAELDELFQGLTASYDDERAQRATVFDQADVAMLVYSDTGVLVDANQQALTLFEAETFEELAAREQNKMIHVAGYMRSPRRMLTRGRYDVSGDAVVDGKFTPCLISGDTIRRADGTIRGNFILLTNVEPLVKDMRRERQNREQAETQLGLTRHRVNEYRQLFESCLVLLDAKDQKPPEMQVTLMPEELVNAWFKESVANGVMQKGDLRHTALPPTLGCPQQMKRIVQKALTVVHKRAAGQDNAVITVTAEVLDDTDIDITIRAAQGNENGPTTPMVAVSDAPVLIAGISRMLPANGGKLLRVSDESDPVLNELAFRIPLDIETYQANREPGGAAADAPGFVQEYQEWFSA